MVRRKTTLYCFKTYEGWWISKPTDYDAEPMGPYKSVEQALGFYAAGRELENYQVVAEDRTCVTVRHWEE